MPGMIKADTPHSHSLLSLLPVSNSQHSQQAAQLQVSVSSATITSEERGIRLIHLLYLCANAVANNNIHHANFFLEQLSTLASLTGDPIQRVATYFMEGLAARITKAWPGLYKALYSTRVFLDSDLVAARHILFNVCPYLKFGFLTVNQTILDVMQGEKVVHVVDLEVCGVSSVLQWLALLQAFSSRPEGPPHLRITAVNEKREVLSHMGHKLSETAERLDIPFQFHSVSVSPADLRRDMLGVKTGEAVAVTSLMQLHRLLADENSPVLATTGVGGGEKTYSSSNGVKVRRDGREVKDESESKASFKRSRDAFENGVNGVKGATKLETSPRKDAGLGIGLGVLPVSQRQQLDSERKEQSSTIDRVLELLHSLSPKIMVVVEQESSHNGQLHERFAPALHYYSAIFDSLDSTLPQNSNERIAVERLIFGQEIGNIVSCEGLERVERHEKLGSWRRRFENANFSSAELSPTTAVQAERLLTIHSPDGYKLQREKGSLTLCWQDTPLLSVSAWEA